MVFVHLFLVLFHIQMMILFSINSPALPANPQNIKFYFCWPVLVRSFTDSDLPDTDNTVPFENTTPINQYNRV